MEIKNINQGLVLKTIEEHAPISRADIGKLIGLTPPTVSAIVKNLIERNIVQEIGKGDSSGGKKPILLQLNSETAFMIAIDLGGENGIRAALIDLAYNIIREKCSPKIESFNSQKLKKVLTTLLTEFITELVEEGIPKEKILRICIGVPGIIDFKEMKVTVAPFLNWEISLQDLNLNELGIPVIFENDVNLMALGENIKGIAQEFDNFVFVGERTGIGAGIVINGKLYQGANNAAGEVGYLFIDPRYAPENPRDYGCLEKLASYEVITKKAREKMGKDIRITEIFKMASQGNAIAKEIVQEALRYLAYGIANISSVLNPELVIIGGGISILPPSFLKNIRIILQKIIPFVPRIEFSRLGEDGVLIGAAVKVFVPLKKKGLSLIK